MCIFLPRLAGETDVLLRCDNIIQLPLSPPPPPPTQDFLLKVGGGGGGGMCIVKYMKLSGDECCPFFKLMVVQTKFAVKAA